MDANKMFNCLLSEIENSGLNYFVSKTPFSANISLKSSFAKHLNEKLVQIKPKTETSKLLSVSQQHDKTEFQTLEIDNLQLKNQVDSLENVVAYQKLNEICCLFVKKKKFLSLEQSC